MDNENRRGVNGFFNALNRVSTPEQRYALIVMRGDCRVCIAIGIAQLTLTQLARYMRCCMRHHANVADHQDQQQREAKMSTGRRHVRYRFPAQTEVPTQYIPTHVGMRFQQVLRSLSNFR